GRRALGGVGPVRRRSARRGGAARDRGLRGGGITSAELAERLARAVARGLGAETVTIEKLHRLAGGASREIWAFDAVLPGGGVERLVLRRDPPGHHVHSSRRDEFALLAAAHAAGLRVPRVRWCEEDAAVVGSPF